jgi:hypothetical protein
MSRNGAVTTTLVLLILTGGTGAAQGQEPQQRLALDIVPLTDLSAFRSPSRNWRIAGGVVARSDRPDSLITSAGHAVLVNLPAPSQEENLFTVWEHGDLELDLEFLVPKGSNSGVYLQGRYELQLRDSWGSGTRRSRPWAGFTSAGIPRGARAGRDSMDILLSSMPAGPQGSGSVSGSCSGLPGSPVQDSGLLVLTP